MSGPPDAPTGRGGEAPVGARFASPPSGGLPWPAGTIAPMTAEGMQALRGRRRSTFLGRIVPYTPYIIQSGLAVTVMLLLILFSAWYTSLVQDVPPGLPIRWILPALLFPLAAWSSFRTYMQPADTVFLLPLETKMRAYFAPAWRGGVVYKLLIVWLVLLVAWPIYIRVQPDDHANLWLSLLLLLGLKLLFAYGAWQEHRFVSGRLPAVFALLRWILAAGMLIAWFQLGLLYAALSIVIGAAVYMLALRFPAKHRVPWERLIAVERAQVGRSMRMLGWFVDVPTEDPRVYRRRWLAGFGRKIPWQQEEAYRFLLTQSFIRGDLLGMVGRLVIVGFALLLLARESWGGVALLLLLLFMIGTQLNGLRRAHADSLWLALYPIPEDSRRRAGLHLMIRVLLVSAFAMWLPFLLTLLANPLLALGGLAAAFAFAWLIRRSAERRWRKMEGEDD
ncbi:MULTISPECIES: ABC transporter permease [Saccharibacillus]|uniref:ABC transporter permease n=1 Tax=Saccharibacillus TaxID=456492 RepID=UPI00123920F2|nr:ABC transporter permease [Saccharibacillus sp. WB 17]MWJ32822.1 ABC transporter [Saccharibacillus sp. WB 17]